MIKHAGIQFQPLNKWFYNRYSHFLTQTSLIQYRDLYFRFSEDGFSKFDEKLRQNKNIEEYKKWNKKEYIKIGNSSQKDGKTEYDGYTKRLQVNSDEIFVLKGSCKPCMKVNVNSGVIIEKAPMATGTHHEYATTHIGNKIYVFGGGNNRGVPVKCKQYDMFTDKWLVETSSLPTKYVLNLAVQVANKRLIFCFGG